MAARPGPRDAEGVGYLGSPPPTAPAAGAGKSRLALAGAVLTGVLVLGLVDDWFVWGHVPLDVQEQAEIAAAETQDAAASAATRAATERQPARLREPSALLPSGVAPQPQPLASSSSGSAATFGFYFPVYDQVPGVLGVVSRVRLYYPESPIHLVQDGGSVDFGEVCKLPKYRCTFEVVVGENSRWNPHSWFRRLRSAALRLQTTFVIYLEPDVLVRRRHTIEPTHDAGGIFDNYNPGVHEETVVYMERRGRERVPCFELEWKHFGLAGGSYFRTEAIIDAFDPVHVERIDWGPMQWREGDKTMSSDFAMIVALACRGWKVYPWKESAQNFERRGLPDDEAGREAFGREWPAYNPSAAFEHDHKEHYGDRVPAEEMGLIGHVAETLQTCHGCVWYDTSGARLPENEPPRPPRQEDWYHAMLLTPALAPRVCTADEKAAATSLAPALAAGPTPNPALSAAVAAYAQLRTSSTMFRFNAECGSQATDFGTIQSPELCEQKTVATAECGDQFMFSHVHPDWGCRCCSPEGAGGGTTSFFWDVFSTRRAAAARSNAQTPAPQSAPALVPAAPPAKAEARPAVIAEPALPPLAPPAAVGPYREAVAFWHKECAEQGPSFGFQATVEECDRKTAAHPDCGYSFMFSPAHPDWQCRCCTSQGRDEGPNSENWNVYDVRTPLVPRPPTTTTTPDPMAGSRGLPLLPDRPRWLVKNDGLVMDARPPGAGGIVILQAVLMDVSGDWGKKQSSRPRWLRSILAANREFCRRFEHAMVVRWEKTQPQLTKWQIRDCERKGRSLQWCEKEWERENINWEKHLMMSEYLLSPEGFSHVFMLDADAAVVRHDLDVFKHMADLLDSAGKDLLLSDEDWLNNGQGRINGGMLFAKNTQFVRDLFQDTFDCHVQGKLAPWRIGVPSQACGSNEQIALNDLLRGSGKNVFAPHAILASGKKYNRGGCVIHQCGDGGMSDSRMHDEGMLAPDLYIMHFMGAMKGGAPAVLCGEGGSGRAGAKDLTGEGPQGYGCQP